MQLSGWGRYPRHETRLLEPWTPLAIRSMQRENKGIVARGNGRSYGDAAIGTLATLDTRRMDRMLAFDAATGRLAVEAGVLLSDVLATFVPRGHFPPVIPGTRFVTIGGMIAADVHGKNHHRNGGFGAHIEALTLALPSGETRSCSAHENAELFSATIGGMGLTGTILDASFRLQPVESGWIRQTTVVAGDLDGTLNALRQSETATYSVAWIDCTTRGTALGRSVTSIGEHASREDVTADQPTRPLFPQTGPVRLGVPFDIPGAASMSRLAKIANELHFRRASRRGGRSSLIEWDRYFFPLDAIGSWNQLYGSQGFLQHQSVIPADVARSVLGAILERVVESGTAPLLAVLKRLGREGVGMLSFPLDGLTLAMDFILEDKVHPLLEEIDRIVVEGGGRIYLAKDARQSRATFEASYPRLPAFRHVRHMVEAEGHMASALSQRLGI